METQDIAHLPKEFILNFAAESIDTVWNKLLEKYQHDNEFMIRVKWRLHDHSDKRVTPMIKDCKKCINA